jgi:hypothetical protein
MRVSPHARATGLILTMLLAGAVAVAAPAGAAKQPTSTQGQHPTGAVPSPGVRANANSTTDQGAGYFLYPTGADGLASVSTAFKMPAFSCSRSDDQEWLLPGIWVFSGGALTEQVDVNFNCNSGTLLQQGYVCLTDGCATAINVAVGDRMVASLAYTPTATVATLKDVTAGTKAQFVGAANTTDQVVLVGDIGPDWFFGGIVTKVPQFAKVAFKTVQINGQYLVDGPSPTPYNLKTASTLQIVTSTIHTDGESFDTTFHHS